VREFSRPNQEQHVSRLIRKRIIEEVYEDTEELPDVEDELELDDEEDDSDADGEDEDSPAGAEKSTRKSSRTTRR
jgi:hypothetical protein